MGDVDKVVSYTFLIAVRKTSIFYMLVMAILVFVLAEYQSLTSLLASFTHPGGNANG